jgi:eukaryotic-like serine/threonine-protein kinase
MTPEQWQRIRPVLESAIELDPASRSAFLDQACNDAAMRREIESLLVSHEQAGSGALDPDSGLQVDVGEEFSFRLAAGTRIGVYEVIDEIAQGGMGAVYRAVRADGQYKQEVALKIVRAELAGEGTATRFKNERQILARLDHPHIAKILDGGTSEGVPYFVMELIDGVPITEYCDRHKLPIEERLRIFRMVCAAVHYAHQHLVIHRDLKPGNILITPDGVPKLLDFGIAKILDPSLLPENAAMTAAGLWMMTPEYASPEQFVGGAITTATDVYSLGLVLYETLTGHRAYQFATPLPHEIARVVLETEPEKPSTALLRHESCETGRGLTPEVVSGLRGESPEKLRRRLAGDLDNIVLKAIRKEAGERYTSADQLSEDIRRYLEGLPVLARNSTVGYRCRKYVLRHKAGVAAAALIFVSLVTGIALTLREAHIARANESRAERRFNDVRELANALMFDIHDAIQDLPGSTTARKLLVAKALQYLDSLNQESAENPGLQRELATAYKRIGDVQGYPYRANLGDTPGALNSYGKNLAIRQSLYAANSGNVADAVGLAEAHRLMAELQTVSNEAAKALENSRAAVGIAEQAERRAPNNFEVLSELSIDYEVEADVLSGTFNAANLGDNSAAFPLRKKVVDVAEHLVRLKPDDVKVQRRMAVATIRMGDQLLLDGRWREALPLYTDAEKKLKSLRALQPENRNAIADMHGIYTRLQQVKQMAGDGAGALAINRASLEITKALNIADPKDANNRLALGQDYGNLADSLRRTGKLREARLAVRDGLAILATLVAASPKNTEFRGMQAAVYVSGGDAYAAAQDYGAALKNYREALSILSQVESADSANVDVRLRIAGVCNSIARMQVRLGDFEAATVTYRRALDLAKNEATAAQPNEQALYSTADSYAGLGELEMSLAIDSKRTERERMEHWQKAESALEHSMRVWSQIKEPALTSPDGLDAIPVETVARNLERCKEAVAEFESRKASAQR